VPLVLGIIVNGNHFQPEWPGPEPIAFLMGYTRSIISLHVNWKVWITEVKAWMCLSGHQYSCPDVFKFPLDLIAGRGHKICPLPTIIYWRGKHPLGGSEYWGGLEGRAEGGEVGVGFVTERDFSGSPFHVYPVSYKEWPTFEYLNSICGANLKWKKICIGDLSSLFSLL
jgi:hypothetical protein